MVLSTSAQQITLRISLNAPHAFTVHCRFLLRTLYATSTPDQKWVQHNIHCATAAATAELSTRNLSSHDMSHSKQQFNTTAAEQSLTVR
jgi:hypothetical protein